MYCPFCGHKLRCVSTFCGLCGKNIKFLYEVVKRGTSEESTGKSVLPTLQESQALKKEKKLALQKKKELLSKRLVKIYVGMMSAKDGELKAVRGMVLPVAVHPGVDADELCEAAELKMKDFDKNLQGGPYFLLYPDGTKIVNIPGTNRPFTLQAYKDALGKAYQRITVYICTVEDFYSQDISTDSSDSAESEAALSDTADAPGTSTSTMDTERNRAGNGIRMFNIPRKKHAFAQNRRRLWLQAIKRADWGTDGPRGEESVCSAHFISGEPSLEHDSPDFVPSIFPLNRKRVTRDGTAAVFRCPDNGHQSTPTSNSARQSVNPFRSCKADLQLLPTEKENVKTIQTEENCSPHQEDVKPPHIIKTEENSSPHQEDVKPPHIIKTEENSSPHPEDLKPPHIIKTEETEMAILQLDPDLYLPPLTDIKTENSSDTDDSEDWK